MKVRKIVMAVSVLTIFNGTFLVSAHADLFGDITKKLSEAGDAIVETSGKVVDGVKDVGEEMGVIEKDAPPADTRPENVDTANDGTQVALNDAAASEPLPGGVTSRIKKMYKELDKVEKKLGKGAGSASDRAKRAKLDLDRAKKYMAEIEQRYSGKYSPEHPDMVAATGRLEAVQAAFDRALSNATEQDAAIAAAEEKAASDAAAEKTRMREQRQNAEMAAKAEREKSEAVCKMWDDKLSQYAYGDKVVGSGRTTNTELYEQWRTNAAEAQQALDEYPRGTCPPVDSIADLVASKIADFKAVDQEVEAEKKQLAADLGTIVFATTPFTGSGDPAGQKRFKAGDNIYGIIRVVKPWSEIYQKDKGFDIRVNVKIDGKNIHAQFVKIKDPSYAGKDFLVFDIAPDPKNMVAYSDPNIEYGKTTASIIQGPNELTHHLSKLTPGSHKISFEIPWYGKTWAAGEFTVEGSEFSTYAALHEKIAGGVLAGRTFPAAAMQNKGLEKEMAGLLEEAGWDNVYRLNIVDKDWWIERVDGGNTAVKARYLAAVALTKKSDGSYCYKKCIFHQDKLITGAFGKLYLSHQGDEVPIVAGNIDK